MTREIALEAPVAVRPAASGRGALRLARFAAVTAVRYAAYRAGDLLVTRMPARRARWRQSCFRGWASAVLRALHVRVSVSGTPPQAPFVLATNHLGYLDIPLLASQIDAVFIAKSEVAVWPVIGRLAASVRTIFIRREAKKDLVRVNELINAALERGEGVVIFPEGTSTDGSCVRRFKTGLLETPARRGLPVQYATIRYRTPAGSPPASESVCWWGEMEFLPHLIALARLPYIEAEIRFAAESFTGGDRRELAGRLGAAVAQSLGVRVSAT